MGIFGTLWRNRASWLPGALFVAVCLIALVLFAAEPEFVGLIYGF